MMDPKTILRIPAVLLLLCLAAGPRSDVSAAESDKQVYLAFWNVENLFDLIDDPGVEDEEFTPAGEKRWTRKRLRNKFHSLTRVFNDMNTGKGPDLLGLSEVENRRVLEQWREMDLEEYARGRYGIALHQSPDERGIDLAVLYRKEVFTHIGTRGHTISLGADSGPTRDVSVFTFLAGTDTLDCVLVHWPSRYGGRERTEPLRLRAARTTAEVIDSLYNIRKNDEIILMGDFNDEPANRSLTEILKAGTDTGSVGPAAENRLFNAMWEVYRDPDTGSYYYNGDWYTLDQILLGHGLLDKRGFSVSGSAGKVFVREYMRERKGEYKGTPYRTYVGDRYLGGISDHFPVFIQLTINKRE